MGMGLMNSMIVGSAGASGGFGVDLGTALWLFLIVNLVASGLGIVAKAHRGRPLDLAALRRPNVPALSAHTRRLCEAGGV